jgi:hypothetical protein
MRALMIVICVSAAAAGGELDSVPPVRSCCEGMPETLADILRRLPAADAAKAYDADQITWAHEAHHFVNSRLSSPGWRGFYLLDGCAYRFPIPKRTTLRHVADAVPADLRGKVFKTYLIDAQRDWQTIALYPFDEAVAYWSGAMVRQEIDKAERQETERYAVELATYCKTATEQIIKREDDDYPKQELMDFLELIIARGRVICMDFDEQPHAEVLATLGRTAEVVRAEDK